MLKQVKFSKLKVNAGFTFEDKGLLRVKTSSNWAKGHKFDSSVKSDRQVWTDDSQIKSWWKLW